jgi:hypothetical protein
MDTTWNDLGKAFWDGGIFGVAKTLMNQRQAQPKTGDPMPAWKDFPLLLIDDRGFAGFDVEDPKWLEKMREVQSVTMARPYPTLRDLECDLVGMRLVTDEEIDELREIGDFILETYGKKTAMEVRVRLNLRPGKPQGPSVSLELADDEIHQLRIITAFVLGHEEGGGRPAYFWKYPFDWGTDDERRQSLCRFAAAIPLQAGTMRLGAETFLGATEVAIATGDFLSMVSDGPIRGNSTGVSDRYQTSPFVHFALFTPRDLPELLTFTNLSSKLMDAAHELEQTLGTRPAPGSTPAPPPPPASPPPIPPLLNARRPKVFVFGPNCPMQGLGQWTECIRKAKESLPETTDLLELSLSMFHSGMLSSAERSQWADKAHEIKDYMGVDNLCEVPVRIDL